MPNYNIDADPAYIEIPERVMDGMLRWGQDGYHPGGFLTAVMKGDLLSAVCRADSMTAAHLPAIVRFVYNQMPSGCHALGSPGRAATIMDDWQEVISVVKAAGAVEVGND
jgi:hypothetical protein